MDVIIGTKTKEDLKPHKDAMLRLSRPKSYNVYEPDNEELAMTNGFHRFVFLVEEHTNRDIRKMPETEVYALLDLIEEKEKSKKKP